MIKSSLLGLVGASSIGAFAICDLCQPAAEAAATPAWVAQAEAAPVAAPVAELKKVTLKVEGMTCGGCAIGARKVLERLDGVQKAEVSYEDSRAVVTYDPKKVTVEQMIAAVGKLGYKAMIVEPKGA